MHSPGAQYILNYTCSTQSFNQYNLMFIASDCFCSTVLFIIPLAVLVSASNVVSGCLGPMFSVVILSRTASGAFTHIPPVSALAADDVTLFLPTMGKLVH